MKRFKTLLWLESRRSWVWALALVASLAFWAWGLNQVGAEGIAERFGIRMGLLGLAAGLGTLVLCFMIGRIRSETRQGQYQILLLTPPSGYVHIAARFAFALAVGIVYAVAIGGLAWWAATRAGIRFDAGSVLQLVLVCPLYGVGVLLAPVLSWTLLLMVFVSAYRVTGTGWIPGTAMVLATPFLAHWTLSGLARVAFTLPSWRLFGGVWMLLQQSSVGDQMHLSAEGVSLPQVPLWGMLAASLVLLALAGRIWQEVEG
jgi:MFS family permease